MSAKEADATRISLIARLQDGGDPAAWQEFERRYSELIYGYARRRGLQDADADDVRQIVLMNLARWLAQSRFEPGRGRFRYYLGKVVQNVISRYCVQSGRRPCLQLDEGLWADLPDLSRQPEGPDWQEEWVRHHYRMAIRTLRERHEPRTVAVFECLLAGERVQTVAERFAMSTDAVFKVRQRLLREARILVEEQVLAEDGPEER